MTFEYILPGDIEVKRLGLASTLEKDWYAVIIDGDNVAEIDFDTARRFWLGQIDIAELTKDKGQ